jgi:hypothetical protein
VQVCPGQLAEARIFGMCFGEQCAGCEAECSTQAVTHGNIHNHKAIPFPLVLPARSEPQRWQFDKLPVPCILLAFLKVKSTARLVPPMNALSPFDRTPVRDAPVVTKGGGTRMRIRNSRCNVDFWKPWKNCNGGVALGTGRSGTPQETYTSNYETWLALLICCCFWQRESYSCWDVIKKSQVSIHDMLKDLSRTKLNIQQVRNRFMLANCQLLRNL